MFFAAVGFKSVPLKYTFTECQGGNKMALFDDCVLFISPNNFLKGLRSPTVVELSEHETLQFILKDEI